MSKYQNILNSRVLPCSELRNTRSSTNAIQRVTSARRGSIHPHESYHPCMVIEICMCAEDSYLTMFTWYISTCFEYSEADLYYEQSYWTFEHSGFLSTFFARVSDKFEFVQIRGARVWPTWRMFKLFEMKMLVEWPVRSFSLGGGNVVIDITFPSLR